MLCLDLDGTLFGSNHQVSQRNADAVAAASQAGYIVSLCSGRGPTMYVPTAEELGVHNNMFMVGYNGAVVFELDPKGRIVKKLFETKMSLAQVDKVLKLSQGLAVEFDVGRVQYARSYPGEPNELLQAHAQLVRSSPTVGELPEVGPGKCEPNKLTIMTADPKGFVAKALQQQGFNDDGIGVVVGGPYWVETVNLNADKEVGIRLLCAHLRIRLEDCVYFGDGANDATSLRACGVGIAMAQAKPEAKQAADRVSQWSNDEDAVALELFGLLPRPARKVTYYSRQRFLAIGSHICSTSGCFMWTLALGTSSPSHRTRLRPTSVTKDDGWREDHVS